ncbi:MAG: biotin-(acetyl-CoA carboxylase) ligase [Limisphaerales bacterium]|jgi:biotin-(acetyl-CoA carboxylase) ligase
MSMEVLTNCPVVLNGWNLFQQDAKTAELSSQMRPVWAAFAGETTPWSYQIDDDGLPNGKIVVVERSDISQFDQMVELAREGAELPECLVAVALEGENFHGQSARPWNALRGNLHLTAILKGGFNAADLQEEISIVPTLALMDALKVKADPAHHTGIRWLNDLFIKGRKVAGTLAASQLDGGVVESVTYGIGVNVDIVPDVPGDPFVPRAGSLKSTLPEAGWTVGKVLVELIRSLGQRVIELRSEVAEQLATVYVRQSACIGEDVRVWARKVSDCSSEAPIASGKLLAIHDDLSIRIEGHEQPITAGRLAFEADCRELGL